MRAGCARDAAKSRMVHTPVEHRDLTQVEFAGLVVVWRALPPTGLPERVQCWSDQHPKLIVGDERVDDNLRKVKRVSIDPMIAMREVRLT